MTSFSLPRLLAPVALTLALYGIASAGGIDVLLPSVQFVGNPKRIFAPRADVHVRFNASEYNYGSREHGYMIVAVVPESESLKSVRREQINRWITYGVLYRDPRQATLEKAALQFDLSFPAPEAIGQYQVLVHQVPMFRIAPLSSTGPFKQIFVPRDTDRTDLVKAAATYPSSFLRIATFTVSREALLANDGPSLQLAADGTTIVDDGPPVYLRAEGKVPTQVKIVGGLRERPLTFSWRVGNEFKRDKTKVVFRYQISPADDAFGVWSTATEVSYFFLPKGVHQFKVQARYVDGATVLESGVASYQFTLGQDLVAKASKSTLTKAPIGVVPALQPKIAFKDVYAKSRALLIGIWQFDDAQNFPQFDGRNISADLAAMEAALKLNGFEVTTLSSGRVTREQMAEELTKLVERSEANDRLFVYFSTHGFSDPLLPADGYLATTDCRRREPSARCMRLNDLEIHADRALTGKKVRQVLFAVDSCFSGLGIVRKSADVPDLTQLAVPQGAFMLTAGMANQLAQIDPKLRMSTFTHFLSEGLKGKAEVLGNNGVITLTELFLFVQYEVARQTRSQQIPMLGRMRGDGEMLFAPTGGLR
jgi:hypothetical protein